jgi:hypothetical protein
MEANTSIAVIGATGNMVVVTGQEHQRFLYALNLPCIMNVTIHMAVKNNKEDVPGYKEGEAYALFRFNE